MSEMNAQQCEHEHVAGQLVEYNGHLPMLLLLPPLLPPPLPPPLLLQLLQQTCNDANHVF